MPVVVQRGLPEAMGCSSSSSAAPTNLKSTRQPSSTSGLKQSASGRSVGERTTSGKSKKDEAAEDPARSFFDKYILGEKLGKGAFAQVRTCQKLPKNGKAGSRWDYAAKVILLKGEGSQAETSKRMQKAAVNEIAVWREAGVHPNIVPILDSFFDDDICFIVMERCASGLLASCERAGASFNEAFIGYMQYQMLQALVHLHQARIVHRDLKPDNFLIGGEDGAHVKLCDFGLAAQLPKWGGLSGVFGTAPFMAPEMLMGRWYDEKVDVWSLAVVGYVLLLGRFPYAAREQTSKAMKQAILEGVPEPKFEADSKALKVVPHDRSEESMTFLSTLLNRDPEKRPDAEEALELAYIRQCFKGKANAKEALPSLAPMLTLGRKAGAFETRNLLKHEKIDTLLDNMQLSRCGIHLPQMDPASEVKPKRSESRATRSTASGSSSGGVSSFKGSAWSKTTARSGTDSGGSGRSGKSSRRGSQPPASI